MSKDSLLCLRNYDFPGNIRELRNILERGTLLADGDILLPEHLPQECACSSLPDTDSDVKEPLTLAEHERLYLVRMLAAHTGDRQTLADKLGVSRRTLFRKLKDLRLEN
mgnify:FL=1